MAKNQKTTKTNRASKFSYEPKLIKTPAFTAAFTNTLGEPDENGKRSLMMCFDDEDELKALVKECKRVANEHFEAKAVKKSKFIMPVREIDEDRVEDYEFLADFTHCANASTWKNIPIVDLMKKRLDALDEEEFTEEVYAGCRMKAMVFAAPFDNESKGVALRIASMIKIADGERISGGIRSNTDEDFSDEFEEGEDDDDKPKKSKKSEPDMDDVEAAFKELTRKQKKEALAEFEVDEVDEVDEDEFAEFITFCEDM